MEDEIYSASIASYVQGVPQLETTVQDGTYPISTIINAPWVEVTSVNGKTGDVEIEPVLVDFKPNYPYAKGSTVLYNGGLYYAKDNFVSGNTFDPSDWDAPDFVQEQADWTENDNTKNSYIKNKPSLATVATSGAYNDLSGKPTKTSDFTNDGADGTSTYVEANELATVATSGAYNDLSGTPTLAAVATSGAFSDLTGTTNVVEDANYVHTDNNYTTTEKTKLGGIEAGAQVNPTTAALRDLFYPVGSYYETSDTSFNPNTTWGGTWVEDTKGKILVAKADSGTFATVGGTGGAEKHYHWTSSGDTDGTGKSYQATSRISDPNTQDGFTGRSYTGNAHQISESSWGSYIFNQHSTYSASNLQPYIIVKRWHRTA